MTFWGTSWVYPWRDAIRGGLTADTSPEGEEEEAVAPEQKEI